jgi:phage-related protein
VRLAVVDALSAIWTAIKTTLERCVAGIIGFVGQFVEAGKAIVKGAEQGVWDAANALLNAVVDAMRRALEAAKRALGIGSPSREFAKGVGLPIMQGVGVGIDDGALAVEQTLAGRMKELLGVALTGAGDIVSGIGDVFAGIDLPGLGLGFGGGGLPPDLKALVDKVPSLLGLAKDLNLVGGDISMMDMGAGPWLDSIGVSWDQVKQIADWVKNGMPGDLGAGIGDLFGGVGDASAKMLEEIKTTLGEMRDLMKEMLAQMRDEWAYRFDDMLQIQMTRMGQMRDRFAGIGREMADIAAWTGGKINEGIGAGGWGAGGVIAAPAPRYAAMPAPIASQREGGATVNINATVNNAEDAELMARRVAVLLQTR